MAEESYTFIVYAFVFYEYLRTDDTVDIPDIPYEIQEIIAMFCPRPGPFRWDKNEHGPDWDFDEGGGIKYHGHRGYSVVKSKFTISAFVVKKIKWAIKIAKAIPSDMVTFQIGFFPSNKEKMITEYDGDFYEIGLRQNDIFAILVDDNHAYLMPQYLLIGTFYLMNACYRSGDEFSLIFDFCDASCTLMFNDKRIDRVYDDIPQSLVPAISCYGEEDDMYNLHFSSEYEFISL